MATATIRKVLSYAQSARVRAMRRLDDAHLRLIASQDAMGVALVALLSPSAKVAEVESYLRCCDATDTAQYAYDLAGQAASRAVDAVVRLSQ